MYAIIALKSLKDMNNLGILCHGQPSEFSQMALHLKFRLRYIPSLNKSQHQTDRKDMDRNCAQAFKLFGSQVQENTPQAVPAFALAVGRIQVYWFDSHSRILSQLRATAFAIGPRTIVTCAHNLFSPSLNKICDRIEFLLERNGRMNGNNAPYRCTSRKQIMFRVPTGPMDHVPTPEELAFFTLDPCQVLRCGSYLRIGHIPEVSEGKGLKLVGYPNAANTVGSREGRLNPIRTELSGVLHSINGQIINYTMPTRVGHSGSPILAQDRQGVYYAVGIHTHRGGEGFNSGLYFSPKILSTAAKYIKILQTRSLKLHPITLRFTYPELFFMRLQESDISVEETDKMYERDKERKEQTFGLLSLVIEGRDLHHDFLDGPEYFLKVMAETQAIDSQDDETDSSSELETNSTLTADSHQDQHSLQLSTQYELNPYAEMEDLLLQHSTSLIAECEEDKYIQFAASKQFKWLDIEESNSEPEPRPGLGQFPRKYYF